MSPLWSVWAGCTTPQVPGKSDERPVAISPAQGVARVSPWSAGEDVPGWPDVACDPGLSVVRYRFDNPTMWRMVGEIGEVGGHVRLVRMYIETRDCASFPCDTNTPRGRSTPFLEAELNLTADDGTTTPTGWWGPDATTARTVRGGAYAVFGKAGNQSRNGHGVNAEVSVCFSRVRPDSVTGVLFFRLPIPGDPVQFWAVDAVEFWSPFTFTLPEHAGVSWPADGRTGGPEGDSSTLEWRYVGVSYDDAWPWADITDASIRDTMYTLYTPSTAP